jgi:hypothetical protein
MQKRNMREKFMTTLHYSIWKEGKIDKGTDHFSQRIMVVPEIKQIEKVFITI